MKNQRKFISTFIFLIFGISFGVLSLNADLSVFSADALEVELSPESFSEQQTPAAKQEPPKKETEMKFPVAKIYAEDYEDITQRYPIDLRTPDNLKTTFEYDPNTDTYLMRTKIGDIEVTTPFQMTREEYLQYTLEQSLQEYFRQKNAEEIANQGKQETFSPFDMKFDLGPADKIFGPGGVQLTANGTVDLKMALTHTYAGDPTRSELNRSRYAFDFDEQIQANVKAKVGDKVNFDMNYNTKTTFDFDSKRLKLAYQGKEDEVLKLLEAGNVSMTTSNSLISGGAALFGIKAEMQFGKLKVGAIFSQQETQSKTISSKKGVQTTPFEFTADAYDENQHFFLAHYFRDNYDKAMSTLPFIKSSVSISNVEVWITNTRSNFDESRNIVAFSDLAEYDTAHFNQNFVKQKTLVGSGIPFNDANNLYYRINEEYPGARNISEVNRVLGDAGLQLGVDYEKVGNARKLRDSEYTFNRQLGYISLKTKLQADEVLAVAFEYTYNGIAYQVGELSTENTNNPGQCMYLKLLKGTTMSPAMPFWHLMMKNIYSLGTYSLQKDKFKLDILHLNDTTGMYLNYIAEGEIANQILLRVMNLDRLDIQNNPRPDGFFDYVEGFTVSSQTGRIIFPVIEPFGSHLREKFLKGATDLDAANKIADKYVFQELYDSTLTVAQQIAEKNKFLMKGEYRGSGSSGGDIDLGTYNVTRGSVRVTSNGRLLTEGSDYTVDYVGGKVTLAQHIAESGAPVSVSLENNTGFGMQRKTLMGVNLEYQFNPDFNIGATLMNLREMPITLKAGMGEESVNNTIYGFNANWRKKSQWLTNMLDKLPFLDLTAPSQITFSAEFAQLIPGHYESRFGGSFSYIDDFERTKITYDLRSPQAWFLASTPYDKDNDKREDPKEFREKANLMNNLEYGNDRSLLAWYTIDPMFTRRRNSLTPTYLRNDLEQQSNHYVREVTEMELYPNKELPNNEPAMLSILNLAYYPNERGPYNLDTKYDLDNGTLLKPKDRWGGIMRKMERSQIDFEAANVEHIEFWMMDPFIYNPNAEGGDLYFNLGEISEDILKDGKRFFENGLPVDGDESAVDYTTWGKVPNRPSTVYAFDPNPANRKKQDVGLNGLSTEEEFVYEYTDPETKVTTRPYADLKDFLEANLSPQARTRMEQDRFSPFHDPAGDNFHHFRGSDYDAEQASILYRYKRFNGTEGNSETSEDSSENFDAAAKITPDIEDINQDNTLNETERYYEYRVKINPRELEVGQNYVIGKRTALVQLRKDPPGTLTEVNWYQFKIPLRSGRKVNGITDFKTIRFMRMYMTNFEDSVVLRFGSLDLVRGGWRTYTQDLLSQNSYITTAGTIDMSVVNIEENGTRTPVNYVLPPGVFRTIDPGQTQMRQENEQAMSLRVRKLDGGDARAVFQSAGLDTRQYRRLQMFVHAEELIDTDPDYTPLQNNELSVFLRMGSDYRNNYYEYEIPLKLTPPLAPGAFYSSFIMSDQLTVWPQENMFDFPFKVLTDLKLKRNKEKRKEGSNVSFQTPYTEADPQKPNNRVTVVGNPTLSDVKVIMIGVRNNGNTTKSGEVWVNELRVTDFNEDGGWAGNANLNVILSDLGSVNFAGRMETAGFGSIEQGVMDRGLDDFFQYNVSANVELGKVFPEKAKVSLPMYYTYSEQVTSSKYNPLDQDVLLKEALDAADSKSERDSIKGFAQDVVTTKSVTFSNVKIGIKSKNPMPWDPDNFNFSYSFAENNKHDPAIEYERNTDTRIGFGYGYSPFFQPFTPFKNMKNKSKSTQLLRDFSLTYLPNSFTFNSEITRNYYEMQLRDLSNLGGENMIDASFREDFFWNRNMSLQWNLLKNLNFSIQTGTQARIETANIQANRDVASRDEYQQWKDTVWMSLRDLGTPLSYAQTVNATYTIPFKSIPILDFMTGSLAYNARYNWDRGAEIEAIDNEAINLGNVISNERTFTINNVTLNLLNFYNKSPFLKKANEKFKMKRPATTQRAGNTGNRNNQRISDKRDTKKFEGTVLLNADSVTVVSHKLNNKRIRVTARGADGKSYDVNFKVVDPNTIKITNKDSVSLTLAISQLPPLDDLPWYKVAQVTARGAMMVRSVGFTYSRRDGLTLPNFMPNIGNAFGQGSTDHGTAPGLDFAFGFTDESYIQRASKNEWLKGDTSNVAAAMFSMNETLTFKATLEPIVGMKIDLNARMSQTNRQETYLLPEGFPALPEKLSGTFEMTTISIGSAFRRSGASTNSQAFNEFLNNREIIQGRLEKSYIGLNYPDAGFISE
ncbi:MAG: cell surface protein SprA, partial [Dysgonamonadaceae bacterium]|nr:cell surface protein SprA [Dysgonamonadaceae bacterium]